MSSATVHVPVMLEEVLEYLQPAPGGVFVDGTLGGGGHTRALAQRVVPGGRVIAVDLDPGSIERAEAALAGMSIDVAAASYAEVPEILEQLGVSGVDGILLDLGLSSDQLADSPR